MKIESWLLLLVFVGNVACVSAIHPWLAFLARLFGLGARVGGRVAQASGKAASKTLSRTGSTLSQTSKAGTSSTSFNRQQFLDDLVDLAKPVELLKTKSLPKDFPRFKDLPKTGMSRVKRSKESPMEIFQRYLSLAFTGQVPKEDTVTIYPMARFDILPVLFENDSIHDVVTKLDKYPPVTAPKHLKDLAEKGAKRAKLKRKLLKKEQAKEKAREANPSTFGGEGSQDGFRPRITSTPKKNKGTRMENTFDSQDRSSAGSYTKNKGVGKKSSKRAQEGEVGKPEAKRRKSESDSDVEIVDELVVIDGPGPKPLQSENSPLLGKGSQKSSFSDISSIPYKKLEYPGTTAVQALGRLARKGVTKAVTPIQQAHKVLKDRVTKLWDAFAQRHPKSAKRIKAATSFFLVGAGFIGLNEVIEAVKGPQTLTHIMKTDPESNVTLEVTEDTIQDLKNFEEASFFRNEAKKWQENLNYALAFVADMGFTMNDLENWQPPSEEKTLANLENMLNENNTMIQLAQLDQIDLESGHENESLDKELDLVQRVARSLQVPNHIIKNCFTLPSINPFSNHTRIPCERDIMDSFSSKYQRTRPTTPIPTNSIIENFCKTKKKAIRPPCPPCICNHSDRIVLLIYVPISLLVMIILALVAYEFRRREKIVRQQMRDYLRDELETPPPSYEMAMREIAQPPPSYEMAAREAAQTGN